MMRNKEIFIVSLLLFTVLFSSAQDTVKTAIPISLEYQHPLYSMYFTSSNSFLATTYENGQEYIRKFEFSDGLIHDRGLSIPDSGVAIGGQINGLPYLYLQYSGDIVPGYSEDSPFSFTSHSEEVFVAGYLENKIVIVNQNGKLNLCKAVGNGDRVRYERIKISKHNLDENGIHIIGDSLYFSRINKSGYYKLHKSVYDHENNSWGDPTIMSFPYNIEGTNSLFYLWYEGVEYISSDRDGMLTIYAIGDKYVKNPLWDALVLFDALSIKEYNHKLKIKIRDKVYEEYVSPNSYGFYNNMVDLTDEMHVVSDGDTVYILKVPKKDLRECEFSIVGCLKSKDGRKDLFMAENYKGEKFTLLPVEFAIENGLEVDNNLVREENFSKKDFILLGGVKYAAYGHSVFDPNKYNQDLLTDDSDAKLNIKTKSAEETKIIADLEDAIRSKREFTEEELLDIFGLINDSCYVQVGFYKNRRPNNTFWSVFRGSYTIILSDRISNGIKVGTQYTIDDLGFKKSLVALSYTINGFKVKHIIDKPFVRIGKWNEKYTIIVKKNGKYVIK